MSTAKITPLPVRFLIEGARSSPTAAQPAEGSRSGPDSARGGGAQVVRSPLLPKGVLIPPMRMLIPQNPPTLVSDLLFSNPET